MPFLLLLLSSSVTIFLFLSSRTSLLLFSPKKVMYMFFYTARAMCSVFIFFDQVSTSTVLVFVYSRMCFTLLSELCLDFCNGKGQTAD